MLTRRDLTMMVAGAALTLGGHDGRRRRQPKVLESQTFEWASFTPRETKVGKRRDVLRSPTATLDELEIHVTTLNPGETPHPPHQHPAEECSSSDLAQQGRCERGHHAVQARIGGNEPAPRKAAKYPWDNKMYHTAIVLSALAVVPTGLFMMVRVRNPFSIAIRTLQRRDLGLSTCSTACRASGWSG